MNIKLGIVMDPIGSIKPVKDTSLAMLIEAQSRNWDLFYMEQQDLFVREGEACARTRPLTVQDDVQDWFELGDSSDLSLGELDVILMRKDPPFDMEYIYSTYILELAEQQGALVVNKAASLRDANEKFFTTHFPQCCPSSIITREKSRILELLNEQEDIIVKPLDGMGGASIFRIKKGDPNTAVIIESVTEYEQRTVIAQTFLPEYTEGDKRILVIDGKPVPYALARIPAKGEGRANLAAGGTGYGIELSEQDLWIAEQVGPTLKKMGLLFAGLDVIGDYLTEINVTSPTCVRELDHQFDINISASLMDAIEERLRH
jgi:glutathione synthase